MSFVYGASDSRPLTRSAVGLRAGSGGKIGATVSLFWRVFLLNGALLVGAGVVLAVSPVRISTPARVFEEVVLAVEVVLLAIKRRSPPAVALFREMWLKHVR